MYKINYPTNSIKDTTQELEFWKHHALTLESKYNHLLLIYAESVPIKKDWEPVKRKIEFGWFKEEEDQEPRVKISKSSGVKDPADFNVNIRNLILQHLNTQDLLNMTEVNKKWMKMAEKKLPPLKLNVKLAKSSQKVYKLSSTRAYKEFSMTYDNASKENAFKMINQFAKTLETISIREIIPKNFDIKQAVFPVVKSLKFHSNMADDICVWLLKSTFKNLQILHLCRKGISTELITFLYTLFDLKELRVVGDKEFYYCWEELAEIDLPPPSFRLEKLELIMTSYTSTLPLEFLTSQNTSLRWLSVEELSDAEGVLYILYEFPLVKDLTISFSENITEHEINVIANSLIAENQNVIRLTLQSIDFMPDEFIVLLLTIFSNLEELNLEFSTLSINIMEVIASRLLKISKIYCEHFDEVASERYDFLKANDDEVNKNITIIETK